jgi:two-component system, NtrC family, nitrogen regulation response regulator NtrX
MKILWVEDDEVFLKRALPYFKKHIPNLEIDVAFNAEEGKRKLNEHWYHAVILDHYLDAENSQDLTKQGVAVYHEMIRKNMSNTPTIIFTSSVTVAEEHYTGATAIFDRTTDLNKLHNQLTLAAQFLVDQDANSTTVRFKQSENKGPLIGDSQVMKELRDRIVKYAPYHMMNVLIMGPNGCGKELVAKEIHNKSPRNKKGFVDTNCAGMPYDLLDRELFGHKKGSFTGADKDMPGLFTMASGSSLFLDEIGELQYEAQAKLLRALQEKIIRPLGAKQNEVIDCRIIAATNASLEERIKSGGFREDLYHRLAVLVIEVPTLEARKEDIPLLVNHFARKFVEDHDLTGFSFSSTAFEQMMAHNWPGNVRELQHFVYRTLIEYDCEIKEDDDIRHLFLRTKR